MIIEYKNLCPNCGNDISSIRLEKGLPCNICLPREDERIKEGKLKKLEERNSKVDEIEEIFQKIFNTKMWAIQRFWVRRFLDGDSFTLISPTGSGKTTIQIILSLYAVSKLKKRCLFLLPTSILVHQVVEKLNQFKEKLNLNLEIAYYHSLMTQKEKKEQLENMNGADIIVTTHLSVVKKEEIYKQNVDIVFVDDVDSFLRRSKSLKYVLKMLDLPKKVKELVENFYEGKITIDEFSKKIENIKNRINGQIIVSGATQKARST
ncbi:MAG: DEAD/DEAH box helicase, partial [Candidatus Aenigmatarchaeota archaeon]